VIHEHLDAKLKLVQSRKCLSSSQKGRLKQHISTKTFSNRNYTVPPTFGSFARNQDKELTLDQFLPQ